VQDSEYLFMVMDLCKGRELFRVIRHFVADARTRELEYTALPIELTKFYMAQVRERIVATL
jgi:hypothetical protein